MNGFREAAPTAVILPLGVGFPLHRRFGKSVPHGHSTLDLGLGHTDFPVACIEIDKAVEWKEGVEPAEHLSRMGIPNLDNAIQQIVTEETFGVPRPLGG